MHLNRYRIALFAPCLVIVLTATVFLAQQRPAAPAGAAQSAVERGKYLVLIQDCNGCHTPFKDGGPDLTRMLMGHPAAEKVTPPTLPAGWDVAISSTNTAWKGPWGISFTTNLTSDRATGIGGWTEAMFVNAIKTGKHLGAGRPILPPMPWNMYKNATDDDLKAIFAYLKTIPAISNKVPDPLPPAGQRR